MYFILFFSFLVGDSKNLTIIYLLALDAQSRKGTHLYNLPACIYDLLSVCVGGVCVGECVRVCVLVCVSATTTNSA